MKSDRIESLFRQSDMEDNTVLLHESVICGHHIYKSEWSLRVSEIVSVDCEHGNIHDHHAVCLLKGSWIIGHAPRELVKYFWFFLGHGGTITCEVTGSRKHGKGLEVPCIYTFGGKERNIVKLKELLQKKSIHIKCY